MVEVAASYRAVWGGTDEVGIGNHPRKLRVVALPSHPNKRGGGARWRVFVAWKRPR